MQKTMNLAAQDDARTNYDRSFARAAKDAQRLDMERTMSTAKQAQSGLADRLLDDVLPIDGKGQVELW